MNIEQEENKFGEFEKSGGQILEKYRDGRPKTWLCGRGPNGEKINPSGIQEKDTVFCLDKDGNWQGNNPDKKVLDERDMWQGK